MIVGVARAACQPSVRTIGNRQAFFNPPRSISTLRKPYVRRPSRHAVSLIDPRNSRTRSEAL